MIAIDYAYYTDVYGGDSIPAEAFRARCRDAAAYVDDLTLGRITDALPGAVLDKCRMAVCAVAEAYQRETQGGEVASETAGKWSRTFATSGTTPAQRRREAAARYLGATGLLYRGVCV